MVFRRRGKDVRPTWYIELTLPSGRVRWSTGTADRVTGKAIERALLDLAARREWDLLEAVQAKRLAVGQLYDAHRARALDELRRQLGDVDLSPLVEEWLDVHGAKVRPDTKQHYKKALRRLMPAGETFPASRFTVKEIEPWLAKYPGGTESRRKAHATLSVFAAYLIRQGVLVFNPLRQLAPPKANAPRLQYLEVERMIELADAQAEPYQSLSAFLHGTGADLSTALALTAGDVDLQRKEVHAAGTKTHARDRIVRVAEWAWPYLLARVAPLRPDERLFPVDRWHARDAHYAACEKLGLDNYWLRDARHSYAVRAARAGTPAELIAKQLGHVDATMTLRVYSRFMADAADRDRWERRATEMDAERVRDLERRVKEISERSTVPNAVPASDDAAKAAREEAPNSLTLDDFEHSRGGTRTRDPGIMSAVL